MKDAAKTITRAKTAMKEVGSIRFIIGVVL